VQLINSCWAVAPLEGPAHRQCPVPSNSGAVLYSGVSKRCSARCLGAGQLAAVAGGSPLEWLAGFPPWACLVAAGGISPKRWVRVF